MIRSFPPTAHAVMLLSTLLHFYAGVFIAGKFTFFFNVNEKATARIKRLNKQCYVVNIVLNFRGHDITYIMFYTGAAAEYLYCPLI